MNSVKIDIGSHNAAYGVTIGSGILSGPDSSLRQKILQISPSRVLIFSNETVFPLYGTEIVVSLREAGFEISVWTIPDGERFKNFEYLSKSMDKYADLGLRRSDAVIALGGGVVGDLAGFASSVYMRGISYVHVPTTLLAMVDSSVGSKTAINTSYGKNLVGTFYPPSGVVADILTLQTLDTRELRAGFYEIVKHGAIGGKNQLQMTRDFLREFPLDRFTEFFAGNSDFSSKLIDLVASQVKQKAEIVENDGFEAPERTDSRSRKILNFGHTVAHALEKVTNYTYFRHGEAVGYGMLAAMEIAKRLEYCDYDSINLLNDVIRSVGPLPDASGIDVASVLDAIAFDKKASGKVQQWVLLEDIGIPRIVSGELIDDKVLREAISKTLHD